MKAVLGLMLPQSFPGAEIGSDHDLLMMTFHLQVPEGSGEQGKIKATGCKIICGAPMTLAVKG